VDEKGVFHFLPGDGRNPGSKGAQGDFATLSRLHIPARPGLHYMEKTFEFGQQLVMDAKPEFFKKIVSTLKTGQ
jgi:hypothetical protein